MVRSRTASAGARPHLVQGLRRQPDAVVAARVRRDVDDEAGEQPAAGRASIPSYMGVLVLDGVTESGSTISGDTTKIVVVKTDPATRRARATTAPGRTSRRTAASRLTFGGGRLGALPRLRCRGCTAAPSSWHWFCSRFPPAARRGRAGSRSSSSGGAAGTSSRSACRSGRRDDRPHRAGAVREARHAALASAARGAPPLRADAALLVTAARGPSAGTHFPTSRRSTSRSAPPGRRAL